MYLAIFYREGRKQHPCVPQPPWISGFPYNEEKVLQQSFQSCSARNIGVFFNGDPPRMDVDGQGHVV